MSDGGGTTSRGTPDWSAKKGSDDNERFVAKALAGEQSAR
jgi:hypothetical protein